MARKRAGRWAWRALLIVIFMVRPDVSLAEADIDDNADDLSPSDMQSGSLLLHMAAGYKTATTLDTEVDIKVSGLVARVSVRQTFHNDGPEWVEGVYVFPLPDKAAVDRMRLHIGDRFIEGEIREKAQAKKEYEQARREGKKASLVEQQRPNMFTTSVANIAPDEKIVVEIEYLEDLRYDDGVFSLRFPMTITPRYIPGSALPDKQGSGWSADTTDVPDASLITPPMVSNSRGHSVRLAASINAGMPLEIIASRYHPVNVSEGAGLYTVELAGSNVPLDHDFELLWRPVPSDAPQALSFTETIDGEPYYLFMLVPPGTSDTGIAPMPREMIFIIDTSGSMHGTSIAQAKQALRQALKGLRPVDRFNIIAFSSQPNRLFADSVPADASNLRSAEGFVQRLDANGGTEMRAALELAFQRPARESHLRQVVFITDGAVGNEEQLYSLIERRLGAGRLFTVGIGSAPNSWFMRKAAESGRGTFTTISALHEVGEKMDRLFRKLESPQVTNISVTWPGGSNINSYPEVVPDLYLGEPVVIKARASGAFRTGSSITISGNSLGGTWKQELRPIVGREDAGIGALWARAHIAALLDAERRGADAEGTRAEVIKTALAHHLVSKHTSLVAIDKTPVRPAAEHLSPEQVANRLAYGQSGQAIFGFPATATNAENLRHTGYALMLLALVVAALLCLRARASHEVLA